MSLHTFSQGEARSTHTIQLVPGLYAIGLLVFIYLCTMFVAPGWLTYMLSLPPIAIIAITTIARIDDIDNRLVGAFWNTRRIGLILTGTYAAWALPAPFFGEFPTWKALAGMWGFSLVWLTTPNGIPWKDYIWHGANGRHGETPKRRASDHN